MPTPPASAIPVEGTRIDLVVATPPARQWPWWVLRVVTTLTTISAFTQAVLAGGILAGHITYLPTHADNALLLALATLMLLATTVLVWRPGRGPGWVPVAGIVMVMAVVLQIGMGYARILAVHVPLGVIVIAGQLLLLIWAWRRPLPIR